MPIPLRSQFGHSLIRGLLPNSLEDPAHIIAGYFSLARRIAVSKKAGCGRILSSSAPLPASIPFKICDLLIVRPLGISPSSLPDSFII